MVHAPLDTVRLPLENTIVPVDEATETLTAVVFAAVPDIVGVPVVDVSEDVIAAVAVTVLSVTVNGTLLLD